MRAVITIACLLPTVLATACRSATPTVPSPASVPPPVVSASPAPASPTAEAPAAPATAAPSSTPGTAAAPTATTGVGGTVIFTPTLPAPPTPLGSDLVVEPLAQTFPAGSTVRFAVSCSEGFYSAYGCAPTVVDLPTGATSELVSSAVPYQLTLLVRTPGALAPGAYDADVAVWAGEAVAQQIALGVATCQEFDAGEFSRAVAGQLVDVIPAGKPAFEKALVVPLQVCGDGSSRRLTVTQTASVSDAGTPLAAPPAFFLYRSRVWPAPDGIFANAAQAASLDVDLPRVESAGSRLEADVTPGLYLLGFVRESFGSSTKPQDLLASVTYRLDIAP